MALVEFVGPCRFKCWRHADGSESSAWREGATPVGRENQTAYVQIAAVTLQQTRNTMSLFRGLLSKDTITRYGIDVGKTLIYALDGERQIQSVTSNPPALEGNRPSFVILNETHWWLANNAGHAMLTVINNNATKSKGGAARLLSITNAYQEGMDSVAERQRNAWQKELDGVTFDTGVLYDSLEAPSTARVRPLIIDRATGEAALDDEGNPLRPDEEQIRAYLSAVIAAVRGDAAWLDIKTIVDSILDTQNSDASSRRFWFNQVVAAEDAWVDPKDVTAAIEPKMAELRGSGFVGDPMRAGWKCVSKTDAIVMFGDGSKADDSTGLVGYRLSDGYTFTIGVWQKDAGRAGDAWRAPRGEVGSRVDEAFSRFNVVGFFFDPSHVKDDVDSTPYWDGIIDDWHRRYGDRLQHWAVKDGDRRHSIMWDMTSPIRQQEFVREAERVREAFKHGEVLIDGHPALVAHLKCAIASPGKHGTTLIKVNRESARKIDLAVCLVGAQMLGRFVLNKGIEEKIQGQAWYAPLS